jgi:hypothetical protein
MNDFMDYVIAICIVVLTICMCLGLLKAAGFI